LKAAWKPHAALQLGAMSVLVSGYLVSALTGHLLPISPKDFAFKYILVAAFYVSVALFMIKCARMIAIERPPHPITELGRWFLNVFGDPKRLANGVHGMAFVFLLMSGFAMWKNQVAHIGGFAWDPAFANMDRWLHFGTLPHEWLIQFVGYPAITAAVNWNYLAWFPVLFVSTLVAAAQPRITFLRQRFLFALLLGWSLGGILLANLFSSAGPVFYGRVTGDDHPYAGLFQYLHAVDREFPLTTLRLQDYLWTAYQNTPSYSTISAMPSMHVTISLLIFLAVRKLNKGLAWLAAIFAFLIMVGSVQLGWHYAIDGYAGLTVALLSWTLAAPIARWDLRRIGLC
jgi:membrane-associated phospholipid phosphatase